MQYRLTLSEPFAQQLKKRLDELQCDQIQLWQLPPEIAAWYTAGWSEAMTHAKRQAREYEHKLDLAYINMLHPKEKAAVIQRRMQKHFEREEAAFFAAADVESVCHQTQMNSGMQDQHFNQSDNKHEHAA